MTGLVTAAVPSFLASLVEFVEALTIVLAVGAMRGWRSALLGAATGALFLAAAVAALGPLLTRLPLRPLQLVVGMLLLFFGMRWLRKAILRYAGVIALHDEAKAYAAETARWRGERAPAGYDIAAIATTFNAVILEGLEVAFIVIGVGATAGALLPAVIGAALAALVVAAAGVALRAPLTRLPENALKFAVGIMLSSFATYWIAEGWGLAWPGGDLALLGIVAAFAAAAACAVAVVRVRRT